MFGGKGREDKNKKNLFLMFSEYLRPVEETSVLREESVLLAGHLFDEHLLGIYFLGKTKLGVLFNRPGVAGAVL